MAKVIEISILFSAAVVALLSAFNISTSNFALASTLADETTLHISDTNALRVPITNESTATLKDSLPTTSSPLKAALIFTHDSYVQSNSQYFGSNQKSSQIETVGAHFIKDQGSTQVDSQFFYSAEENTPYYDIAEFSQKFGGEGYTLTVGRHREEWSQQDSFWRYGYWQPRFAFDPLHPTEDGLIGIFYEPKLGNDNVHITVLASPMFDPETDSSFHEDNNNVVSQNPWFRNPPPIVQLWSKDTPVHMRVDMPNISDVLFKPSAAAKIDVREGDAAHLHAAYAYKPMNTPVLGYNYFLKLQSDNTKYMDVTIEPVFDYHHIATLENPVTVGNVTITPSVTYDSPVVTSTPAEWIAQDLSPSYMGSLTANLKIDGNAKNQLYGGVMHMWGELPSDRGENAQDTSQFQLRQQYVSAARLGFTTAQSGPKSHASRYTIEATYDPWQNGGQLLNQYDYSWSRSWITSFRADLIGVFSEPTNATSEAFYPLYRANSVASVDVSYVF